MLKKTLDWKNASWSGKPAGAIARGELPHEDQCDHNFTSDDADGEEDDGVEDVGVLYMKNSSMNVYVGETALTN